MMNFYKRLICLVLCGAMLICVASCGKKDSAGNFSPNANTEKQEDDIPYDETESEESAPFEYEEDPVSSLNNYEEAENEILEKQPSSSKASSTTTSHETKPTPDDSVYTGKNYGDTPITKENLDFEGKSVTLVHEWEPYKSANFWDKTLTQKVPEIQKKYNVNLKQQQAKVGFAAEMLSGTVPTGHLYAIGSATNGGIYDLLRKGYIADLSSAITATGIDMTTPHYDPFNTGIFNVNGKRWTIGFGYPRVGTAVLYHTKLIKSIGYDIPDLIENNQWTWNKMTEIALKATVRNASGEVEQWGIGIGNTGIKGLILSNGGHFMHPNSEGVFTYYLNTDNTKQALKQVYDWCNTDRVATFYTDGVWSAGNTAFVMGNVAMYFADESAIIAVADKISQEDLGVAYLPMGPAKTQYVSYVSNSYCYVVPSYYSKITTELLLLMDDLFSGATSDTQTAYLESVWKTRFATEKDYDVYKKLHFDTTVERLWEGSDYIDWKGTNSLGFESLVNGSVVPDVFVENNYELYNAKAEEISKEIKYTGTLIINQ